MKLFGLLKGNDDVQPDEMLDKQLRNKLVELVLGGLKDESGKIRAEDAICAMATIVAERCIDAAGDFALREHEFTPGSRVFSNRANELICGDVADVPIAQIPQTSIVGTLRKHLDKLIFCDDDFPKLPDVFKEFATRNGNPADWGKVPLSVGAEHAPLILPLRVGFETRPHVDSIFHPIHNDRQRCLRVAAEGMGELLAMVSTAIDRKVALTLTIETINGMAKTAPMTEKAMRQAQQTK